MGTLAIFQRLICELLTYLYTGCGIHELHIVIVYYIVLPACAGPATYIQMQYVANVHGSLYIYVHI